MPHEDPVVCAELTEMRLAIDAIGKKMDTISHRLEQHADCEYDTQKILAELVTAFPDGPVKHRESHEEWIRAAKKQQEFWETFWDEAKKKGMLFTLYAAIGIFLIGIKLKLIEWMTGSGGP